MSYYDMINSYDITEYTRGYPMQSGCKVVGKHSFEVRIHLAERLLRVASLPGYASVAELDDPNKIDPKVDYHFFVSLACLGDIVRIKKINIVSRFDRMM